MKRLLGVLALMTALSFASAAPPASPALFIQNGVTNNTTLTNITAVADNVCIVKPGGTIPLVTVYGAAKAFKTPNTTTIAWDNATNNPPSTFSRVYYGPVSTTTTNTLTVLSNVTVVVFSSVLDTNLTYWFLVKAVNDAGLESEPSNVVVSSID